MMRRYDVIGWVEETQRPLSEQGIDAEDVMQAAGIALFRMQPRSGGHPVRITSVTESIDIRARGPIALAVQFERSAS